MAFYGNGEPPKERFYGNGEPPKERFYGLLAESRKSARQKANDREAARQADVLKKWPNLEALHKELQQAEESYLHEGIALEHLREEYALLKKLTGI